MNRNLIIDLTEKKGRNYLREKKRELLIRLAAVHRRTKMAGMIASFDLQPSPASTHVKVVTIPALQDNFMSFFPSIPATHLTLTSQLNQVHDN